MYQGWTEPPEVTKERWERMREASEMAKGIKIMRAKIEEKLDHRIEEHEEMDTTYPHAPDVVAIRASIATLLDILGFEDTDEYKAYKENKPEYNTIEEEMEAKDLLKK